MNDLLVRRTMSRMSNLLGGMIHWLKFEAQLSADEVDEPELNEKRTLLYLKPEALRHVVVINDLEKYQSSPEFVEGGRLIEVSKQYNYTLRQVADLVEALDANGNGVLQYDEFLEAFPVRFRRRIR